MLKGVGGGFPEGLLARAGKTGARRMSGFGDSSLTS